MVINELATNTVKYAQPAEGFVAIKVEAEGDPKFLVIRYRDNGLGYPVEVLAKERAIIVGELQSRNVALICTSQGIDTSKITRSDNFSLAS